MLEVLDDILKKRKMTYYQLHKITGISTGVFSNLKKKQRRYLSFENMKKIADALEISLDIFR